MLQDKFHVWVIVPWFFMSLLVFHKAKIVEDVGT